MNDEPRGFYLKATHRFVRLDSALAEQALAPGPSMMEIRRQIMRKLCRELSKRAATGISPEHPNDLDVLNHSTLGETEAADKGSS